MLAARSLKMLWFVAGGLMVTLPACASVIPPGGTDLSYQGETYSWCYLTSPPKCFTNGMLTISPPVVVSLSGGNQVDQFAAQLNVLYGGLPGGSGAPLTLTGVGTVTIFGDNPAGPGTFSTEMTQLDLSGGGIMLRESPTLVSAGQTTVGTDGFLIGSFFDIFTELSLDGGATWGPAAQNGDP